jgi:hypothetical protein
VSDVLAEDFARVEREPGEPELVEHLAGPVGSAQGSQHLPEANVHHDLQAHQPAGFFVEVDDSVEFVCDVNGCCHAHILYDACPFEQKIELEITATQSHSGASFEVPYKRF